MALPDMVARRPPVNHALLLTADRRVNPPHTSAGSAFGGKNMKLRKNEYCPTHKAVFCCGRKDEQRRTRGWVAVQRLEDPHHPRGYRELRSPAEMHKLLARKIIEQDMKCGICGEPF